MKKVRAILIFSWGIWGSSLFIQLNPMFLIKIVPPQKLKKNWGSRGAIGAVFGAIFIAVSTKNLPILAKMTKATEFEALVLGRCPTFFGGLPQIFRPCENLKPAWLLA